MTAKEILVQARGYIEKGWCRTTAALDKTGMPVASTDPSAVAWCAVGAVTAADGVRLIDTLCPAARHALDLLEEAAGYAPLAYWNDYVLRTKEEVLAAFDKAIELADEEAK